MRIEQRAEQDALAADRPDQLGAADDRAGHHVAVAGGVLRQAVQVQVDAVLAVVVETGEGVVERGQRAVRVRGLRDARDVGDAGDRVGRRLEIDEFRRALGEHALDAGVVLDGQHRVRDAESRKQSLDQLQARPIGFDEAQQVVAGLELRQEAGRD